MNLAPYINPELICDKEGHVWEEYIYHEYKGYGNVYSEQAGYCTRCGFDTHGQYEADKKLLDQFSKNGIIE